MSDSSQLRLQEFLVRLYGQMRDCFKHNGVKSGCVRITSPHGEVEVHIERASDGKCGYSLDVFCMPSHRDQKAAIHKAFKGMVLQTFWTVANELQIEDINRRVVDGELLTDEERRTIKSPEKREEIAKLRSETLKVTMERNLLMKTEDHKDQRVIQ